MSHLFASLERRDRPAPPCGSCAKLGYWPDFMKLKAKYDFFTRCQTPELATEITVMPIDQIGTDAAIVLRHFGGAPAMAGVWISGQGPYLANPVRRRSRASADAEEALSYVMDAIVMTKQTLNDRVPLIGFAGSP